MLVVVPDAVRRSAVQAGRMDGMDRLVLEVDHGTEAPSGFVVHGTERQPFQGYAELVNEVERVRSADTRMEQEQ